MRNIYKVYMLSSLLAGVLLCGACSDEKELTGKWKLERYETSAGDVCEVDSAFFNFMKGTFSMICVCPDDEYVTFFGNYVLHDDVLDINLRSGDVEKYGGLFRKYLDWDGCSRSFQVEELSRRDLQLAHGDSVLYMRKY